MFIFIGLGNPGSKYAGHRHNIGFMMLDVLHDYYGFSAWRQKHNAKQAEGHIANHKIILQKPQLYMNKSGLPVHDIMQFYRCSNQDIIVIHDDIDLVAGKVRVKQAGGHGGHNGLRDIDRHIGPDYRRLRIGVGRPHGSTHVDKHVLSDFNSTELKTWVTPLLECMAKETDKLINRANDNFMTSVAHQCPPYQPAEMRE